MPSQPGGPLRTTSRLGDIQTFFSNDTTPRGLALTGTKAASSGVLINTYAVAEALRSGSSGDATV